MLTTDMRDASSILRFSFFEILATNLGIILPRRSEGNGRAVGPKELKVTLVGGHVFLAEVQQGSDPDTQANYILTYGATEEHADGSYTIHPLSRISSVTVQTLSGPH